MDMSIRFPNLGAAFGYVPRSVQLFSFEISIYGILIAAGMLLGLGIMLLEAKRARENLNQCLMAFIFGVFGAIIGARLVYVAFSWKLYAGDYLEILRIDKGGLSIYGGLFGGILAVLIYCGIRKISFVKIADLAVLGLTAGQMVGRWGDFFNRESFGDYTDGMFAMQLPLTSVRTGEVTSLMRENLVMVDESTFVQVHPAFLYESVWCLLLLLILLTYTRRKKFQGEIFVRYLAGYGLGRFFIEWIRTDCLMIAGIPAGMIVSALLAVVFGTIAFVERSMMKKREVLRKKRNEAYYEAEEKAAAKEDEQSL